jgi:hypothetical protein
VKKTLGERTEVIDFDELPAHADTQLRMGSVMLCIHCDVW